MTIRSVLARILGVLVAVGPLFAQCPMSYQPTAVQGNVGVEVTELGFGSDATFVVTFQPKVSSQPPAGYTVGGQLRLQVEMSGIGYAYGCMPLRNITGPKSYRFRIVGIPPRLLQPGLLPTGAYTAEVTLAFSKNGAFYKDKSGGDDTHALTQNYRAQLQLSDPTVTRKDGTKALFEVTATNTGMRSTGPLRLRWLADDVVTATAAGDPIAPKGNRKLSYTFNKLEKKAGVEVYDSLGNPLGEIAGELGAGTTPTDPPDPNRKKVDYAAGKELTIQPDGTNKYVLKATVTNVGLEKPQETRELLWSVLPAGAPITLETLSIPPLEKDAKTDVKASVDLNGLDPEVLGNEVKFSFRFQLAGDEDPENNVSTGSTRPSSSAQGAEPPLIKGSPVEKKELLDPAFAGEPGIGTLWLRLRNEGGPAKTVTYSVSVSSGDIELPKNKDGTIEGLDRVDEAGRGLIKLEKISVQPAAYGKTHKFTITGKSRYMKTKDEEVDGPPFSVVVEVPIGPYPKPELELKVLYQDVTNPSEIRFELCKDLKVTYQVSMKREGPGKPIPLKPETPLKITATIKSADKDHKDIVDVQEFTAADFADLTYTKEKGGKLNCMNWRMVDKGSFAWSAELTFAKPDPKVEETTVQNNKWAIQLTPKNGADCPDPAAGAQPLDECVTVTPDPAQ